MAKFAQSVPQTCCPLGHVHSPPLQAAASGHLVAQSPQCEALLCVSTHSVPHATPLLHVTGAPVPPVPALDPIPPLVPALDPIMSPAAPPVPAPDPLNKPLEPPPQWISPRAASRVTRQRRAPWAALQAEPLETPRSLDGLGAEVEGGRILLKPNIGVPKRQGLSP